MPYATYRFNKIIAAETIRFIVTVAIVVYKGLKLVVYRMLTIQLSMPKNPLEDLKWLPELVKSEDERLDIIERLGFPIIEQDAEGFVHIPLFPSQSKRDEDLLQEFINGKWRFMIAACTMRKRFPDKRQETTTRGFDVERVDAALPEIRERLKCRVWKSWDLNENQFFSCEDDDFPAWQFKRIGWSIYPDIPYPEEGGDK